MTANVSFVFADRPDVLRVPNAALRFRPSPELLAQRRGGEGGAAPDAGGGRPADGAPPANGGGRRAQGGTPGGAGPREPDRRTVWVLREAAPTPVRIRTGVSDGTTTEIVEGELREGDAVVTDASGGERPSGPPQGGGMRRIL
jgi:HlyD family secretion protein